MLRIALPSDGELHEPTLAFLRSCGFPVRRPSSRRYTGEVLHLKDTVAVFQRAADITSKVEEGSADLGIVGLDRFMENRSEGGRSIALVEDLGYSDCELALAVPEPWIDVSSVADLAELAMEFRDLGRELRIATKYPRLVRDALLNRGINYFTLVPSSGTLEAAPTMGYADMIADIVQSGETLRENRLKLIEDGVILRSHACLIGNPASIAANDGSLASVREVLELVEARLKSDQYYLVNANVSGTSEEDVAAKVVRRPEASGVQGPTVARVHSKAGDKGWYAVEVLVEREKLMAVVEHLRQIGASSLWISQTTYIFPKECDAFKTLVAALPER